ncbi:MAG: TetR/AcrR family transcriptional regulator [Myxococcota bacterium]
MNRAASTPKKKDGRTLRGERSRLACAKAMLDLIREGHLQPTAAAVADRAGVSLRLVFHHFKDMEGVMQHAMKLQSDRIAPLIPITLPEDGTLLERLTVFVDRRAAFFEEITPVRRAARHVAAHSTAMAEGLDEVRHVKQRQLAHLFRQEIAKLPEEERDARVAAAQAQSSWMAWESLRAHAGLDVDAAKAAVVVGLRGVFTV